MKKLIISLFLGLSIVSCKDKTIGDSHPYSHSTSIVFDVDNESNIGSYNIYRNDGVIGQLAANSSSIKGTIYKFNDQIDITIHPKELEYTVEPIFYDSATANTDVTLKILVDDIETCSNSYVNLKYGEVAEITCTVK